MDEASYTHGVQVTGRAGTVSLGHNGAVTTALSALPAATRRRGALGLFGFAALFAIVGVLSLFGGHVVLLVLGIAILVMALTLALAGWGMWRSIRVDASEKELDRAIEYAMAAHGGMCDCGHEHDPEELHVTDACAHDGTGAVCAHDCQTCVLAALRDSPLPIRE